MLGFLMIIICWFGAELLSIFSDFSLFESFVIVTLGAVLATLSLMIKNNK